jgi:CelD/BcsL family acetyltransferase involved in cellulose biosynthesis
LDFFRSLFHHMVPGGLATFYLAWKDGEAIGGNIVLRYNRMAYDWMWVYDERHANLRPTNAMIDRAIKDEIERGASQFNLGASPHERLGSVRFKKSFGADSHAYRIFFKTSPIYDSARRLKQGVGRVIGGLRGERS